MGLKKQYQIKRQQRRKARKKRRKLLAKSGGVSRPVTPP